MAQTAAHLMDHAIPSTLGIWRRTDAEGRARVAVPLPGRWVPRGTALRRSASAPDQFDSRFFTVAFEIQPRDTAR